MGFERHAIPPTGAAIKATKRDSTLLRKPAVVRPLHPPNESREPDALRLARQMRGEWRKQRYSRLAGN